LDLPETLFKGYTQNIIETSVDLIIQNNNIVKKVSSGLKVDVIFNETIFYAESGGQISDFGTVFNNVFKANVLHSKKMKLASGKVLHISTIEILEGNLSQGDKVTQKLDIELRKQICSHHSATHLLHETLRQKLGLHVAQKGSLVSNEKLRFDFSHSKPITSEEIKDIEDEVNYRIFCNDNVVTKVMSPNDAIELGAIALFGEKYGDEVRVVSIGKATNLKRDAWSVELCGGTHVKNTSEISSFKIISETGVSSGVRRIEAVTNKAAINYYNEELNKVKYITKFIRSNAAQVTKKVEQLVIENEKLTKELKSLKKNSNEFKNNNFKKELISNVVFLHQIYPELPVKELKPSAENLIKNNGADIVCLISKVNSKASIVISVNKSLAKKISAVDLVNTVSEILGGKGGGGRPDMAQSGGSKPEKSTEAINTLKNYIAKIL